GLDRHGPVVRLLRFRQGLVRNQAGMLPQVVVSLRAVPPALGQALLRPALVRVLRQHLGQADQVFSEGDARGAHRVGPVLRGHGRGSADAAGARGAAFHRPSRRWGGRRSRLERAAKIRGSGSALPGVCASGGHPGINTRGPGGSRKGAVSWKRRPGGPAQRPYLPRPATARRSSLMRPWIMSRHPADSLPILLALLTFARMVSSGRSTRLLTRLTCFGVPEAPACTRRWAFRRCAVLKCSSLGSM